MQNSKGFEAGMRLGLAYLEKTAFEELSDFEKEAVFRRMQRLWRGTGAVERGISRAVDGEVPNLVEQLTADPRGVMPQVKRLINSSSEYERQLGTRAFRSYHDFLDTTYPEVPWQRRGAHAAQQVSDQQAAPAQGRGAHAALQVSDQQAAPAQGRGAHAALQVSDQQAAPAQQVGSPSGAQPVQDTNWFTPAAVTAGGLGVGYGVGQATAPVPQSPTLRQLIFG